MIKIIVYLFFLMSPFSIFAQEEWELKKDKDGIKIYNRQSAVSRLADTKVEVDLPGNI